MYNYNAPCPFGSGNNTYYFTLYALSDDLQSTVEAKKETKEKFDVGLKMILYASKKGMILGSAQLAVSFCMYSDEKVRGSFSVLSVGRHRFDICKTTLCISRAGVVQDGGAGRGVQGARDHGALERRRLRHGGDPQ